jgi:D-beta-D-heptose 7-phosphate kinase/D-beta-D-heptose 1-phosphate adenosyltransferase
MSSKRVEPRTTSGHRLAADRRRALLSGFLSARILVVGDVMLDQFIWGRVTRISPEAPVPVVEFERESFMPGGAANVARNLTALGARAEIFGAVGHDHTAAVLSELLQAEKVGCKGLISIRGRLTSNKTRIVAGQQQVTRLDRESRGELSVESVRRILHQMDTRLAAADAVVVGDYGKGVVTQLLLDGLRDRCRAQGKWLSLDPKPVHELSIRGMSLITPNRKEAFELAGLIDNTRNPNPLADLQLLKVAEKLLAELSPALLLITLGELGMFLCQSGQAPVHIPTVAREVFDVSGAGDTVIGTFTLAIAAGASPVEAAILSNHAAGVVVGKFGTATVTPAELEASFEAE